MAKSGGARGLRGLSIPDGLSHSARRRAIVFMVRLLAVAALNPTGSRHLITEPGSAWSSSSGDSAEASRKKLDLPGPSSQGCSPAGGCGPRWTRGRDRSSPEDGSQDAAVSVYLREGCRGSRAMVPGRSCVPGNRGTLESQGNLKTTADGACHGGKPLLGSGGRAGGG